MATIAIRLDAGHDSNGNPRRVFVLIDGNTGSIVDTRNEGYAGNEAWREFHPEAVQSVTFKVSAGEYRDCLKFAHDHLTLDGSGKPTRHAHANERRHRHPDQGLGASM